uniref:Uncharacterized protein n=1 Tax=Oryza barthii TaxID=65489 RepID=A0A0D3EZF1_9ORYZ
MRACGNRRKSRSSRRTTSAEIEIKPGNGVRVRAEVEIKPPDIELEPETGRHDGNKSRASVTPCWRRLTPCWLDYELEMRGRGWHGLMGIKLNRKFDNVSFKFKIGLDDVLVKLVRLRSGIPHVEIVVVVVVVFVVDVIHGGRLLQG